MHPSLLSTCPLFFPQCNITTSWCVILVEANIALGAGLEQRWGGCRGLANPDLFFSFNLVAFSFSQFWHVWHHLLESDCRESDTWASLRSSIDFFFWVIQSSSQSPFHFIPEVLNRIEVRSLCRPVTFFHKLGKTHPYGSGSCPGGVIVTLKQEMTFLKLPRSWKHMIGIETFLLFERVYRVCSDVFFFLFKSNILTFSSCAAPNISRASSLLWIKCLYWAELLQTDYRLCKYMEAVDRDGQCAQSCSASLRRSAAGVIMQRRSQLVLKGNPVTCGCVCVCVVGESWPRPSWKPPPTCSVMSSYSCLFLTKKEAADAKKFKHKEGRCGCFVSVSTDCRLKKSAVFKNTQRLMWNKRLRAAADHILQHMTSLAA